LCYAPPDSEEIALAYANRSLVYFELGHFEKALQNIQLAKDHNYPKNLIEKLNEREAQCLEVLNNVTTHKPSQELESIRAKHLNLKIPGNKKMPYYIADCLELKKNVQFGRHIVTNQDLKVGTVLAIEEPFSKIVLAHVRYERCANCLAKNHLNLLPCDSCCVRMFCSEECKKMAHDKFHQYDCGVVDILDAAYAEIPLISLNTFFEALDIFNHDPLALSEFLKDIKSRDGTIFDFDFAEMNELDKKKALLQSIHSLMSADSTKSSIYLFQRFIICANLCDLIQNNSKLGSILNAETSIMFRRFMFQQMQTAMINYHGLKESNEVKTALDCLTKSMWL
jgi:hypothetical protein